MINALASIILLFVPLFLYRRVLRAPFVFDDLAILQNINFLRLADPLTAVKEGHLLHRWTKWSWGYLSHPDPEESGLIRFWKRRPLTHLLYEWNASVFGLRPMGWRLTGVLVAGAMVVVTYHLLLILGTNALLAFVGAMLVALHPLLSMSIAYVAGRSSLLAALFILLSLLLFLHGCWYLTPVAIVLALLSKEEGVVAIALVLGAWAMGL